MYSKHFQKGDSVVASLAYAVEPYEENETFNYDEHDFVLDTFEANAQFNQNSENRVNNEQVDWNSNCGKRAKLMKAMKMERKMNQVDRKPETLSIKYN